MRRLLVIAAVLSAGVVTAWVAYPPSREWPGMQQIGNLVGASETATPDKDKATKGAEKGGRGRGGPVPVLAATSVAAEMPIILSAPGTVEPFATVEVKPRVDGQIAEVAFTEGQEVKAGDVLFRLDDRLIKAQMRQAEANINRDRASLTDAEAILKRRETLVAKSIVSEQATETQRSAVEVLKASIAAGEAQLEAWRTQLDYLTIRAPITGRTGSAKTKIGANVRMAELTPLVVINQTRPISVSFSVPQVDLAALRRALASRSEATVRAAGEKPIEATGSVVFIDNQVDRQTGTLLGKIAVPNENEVLWPGLAVDVDLVVERRPGFVSVPASAVLPSQMGMLAWVINEQGTATPRPVKLTRVIGSTAYVSDGLSPGEVVVMDGQLRLSPGARVIIRDPNQKGAPPQRKSSASDKHDAGPGATGDSSRTGGGRAQTPNGRT
jgi:multidrug efflux system membrane fusion protein